ncbi:MAG: hypothetical protein JWM07_605 [Candidatus Saccharibacteria bacterium]|nr:hypothetical protein [Candidatus Saccharibacteria bacterium]
MLDIIEVGSYNEKTALTMQFDIHTIPLAVNVAPDDQRIWGVHKHHNMRRPGVSPFIERPVLEDELGFITIQILRLRNSVMLLRAYGGQEIRGLPWMKPKDPDAAKRYWHENAFLARGYYMIKPNTTTLRVPDWYQPLSVKN